MHAAIARRSAVILVAVLLLAWPAVPRVQAQRSGGTLTIARPVDAVSLDPHFETTAPGAWVYQMILEPLITLGPDMKIKPVLASSYRVLDATRIRFTLRRGVRFHDGTPF
ncbi:MAG: hypothetical protein QN209_09195, partial [Armatimonadota bacterium]|nr:hypothetical protein [Armatimonadota bacterium]